MRSVAGNPVVVDTTEPDIATGEPFTHVSVSFSAVVGLVQSLVQLFHLLGLLKGMEADRMCQHVVRELHVEAGGLRLATLAVLTLHVRLNEGTLQLLPVASQAFCAGVFENTAPDLRI